MRIYVLVDAAALFRPSPFAKGGTRIERGGILQRDC